MTVFPGDFEVLHGAGQPIGQAAMERPTLRAAVTLLEVGYGLGLVRGDVRFLIDSGADRTVLQPRDAERLCGVGLFEIDFDADPMTTGSQGIGQGRQVQIEREAEIGLWDEDGQLWPFQLGILIARPDPPQRALQGNWGLPSLLGRDVLEHLDLHLSYNPPAVYLSTPDL